MNPYQDIRTPPHREQRQRAPSARAILAAIDAETRVNPLDEVRSHKPYSGRIKRVGGRWVPAERRITLQDPADAFMDRLTAVEMQIKELRNSPNV